jgi:hypothetical protein
MTPFIGSLIPGMVGFPKVGKCVAATENLHAACTPGLPRFLPKRNG